ncbi:LVIVD repeat-containing protein [Lutibacter sp.]|uniref:LVIVD repeat-containing protein n=1 Tax=Lutibacter sp. TaxID=1925666 RepID=UPI00273759E2|nr:hypothetical protein [Lutibacter sp.]MDP3311850.1 hypothetical protein [Lutibacter sp.]
MKKIFLLIAIVFVFVTSCTNDDNYEYYDLATPVMLSFDDLRKSVDILPPIRIEESGKIYYYNKYIFVNDMYKGIHIINNTNPEKPIKISFLKIHGNVDISVKNNFLYADSFMDLLVFDISDINNIKLVNRLKDVFPYYYSIPQNADVDWRSLNMQNSVVIDWVITRERREINSDPLYYSNIKDIAFAESGNTTGQGGSMARFKIVNSYLYAVDSHSIHIFDINNLNAPTKLESVHAGFDIETIFSQNQYLFLGSMSGMFIYDITKPSAPQFVSEFRHGTACDPVVVDDKYAYITLRAGNFCGAFESSLQIVDISDIKKPVLKKSYAMKGPYGLGIKDEKLFICDGNSGLKVYDKTDVNNIVLLNHFNDINTFDVIPLESHLLMIGKGVLYQYSYENNAIKLLSTFNLN